MNLSQALMQNGSVDSMADELGVDRATAQQGASALLPAIVAGLGRQTTSASSTSGSASGLGGLGSILGGLTGASGAGSSGGGGLGGILLDSVLNKQATPTAPGNDILGEIFGHKDVSRGVAEEAAGASGISPALLKKMLPILVTAVMGYMLKQHGDAPSASSPGQTTGGQSRGSQTPDQGGGLVGGALGGLLGRIASGMGR